MNNDENYYTEIGERVLEQGSFEFRFLKCMFLLQYVLGIIRLELQVPLSRQIAG